MNLCNRETLEYVGWSKDLLESIEETRITILGHTQVVHEVIKLLLIEGLFDTSLQYHEEERVVALIEHLKLLYVSHLNQLRLYP